MYGQHGHGVFPATFATDTTLSTAISVFGCNAVALEIQTFAVGVSTTTANVYVQVCDTSDGTYRRLAIQGVYSAGSGILDWEVPSSTGSRYYQLPNEVSNYNYAKVELSKTCTATLSLRVHKMH